MGDSVERPPRKRRLSVKAQEAAEADAAEADAIEESGAQQHQQQKQQKRHA